MQDYPLVTIVTPSYNQGRFIEATIQSVLIQDYPNLEYLVIDGGSTDNTLDILRKYEGKLKWISEKDNGQSDAINKGFKMANGEIVAWLNSDDTYEPGAIHAAVEYFKNHKNVGLVYGEGDIIDEHGNKVKRFEATQEFDLWTLIHVWDYIMQPATFFRRDALQKVNYLDVDLYWCMDWELWIKLASIRDVGYINQVFANSREYAETKTSTGGWKRFREIVNVMRKYGNERYSAGYFLYGSSTLYTEYKDILLLKPIVGAIMYFIHKSVHRNLPIKYKDNWIGPKYSFSIPPQSTEIIIRGNTTFENYLPLKVTIYMKKDTITTTLIQNTSFFEIKFSINKSETMRFVTLKVNNFFIPAKISESTDNRKLAMRIEDIITN